MQPQNYDLIVIGGGSSAENVADRAVQGGLTALIVESELVGGECSYWACMPSKALIRVGTALSAARRVPGAAEAVQTGPHVAAALSRRDTIANAWSDSGQLRWLASAGIDLLRGHGRLSGVREVTVTAKDGSTTVLTANHAVALCTGSAALLPSIPGLAESAPWTSREATSAHQVPASLAIIGGGVVAAEMATAYSGLGASVTLIARSGLLTRFEPFAGELVTNALRESGVTVLTDVTTTQASRTSAGEVQLRLSDGSDVTTTKVLVATGRAPRTTDLGLETIGLPGGDWLGVDDTLLVQGGSPDLTGAWLYAIGDVNGRALLTHQGKYQARAAGDVIAARANGTRVDDAPWGTHVATADHSAVPQVTFTDPEVASVGLTVADAEIAGYRIRVLDYDLSWLGGSTVLADGYVGHARIVVDEERHVLLGATFVGQDVAELLHAATIAIVGEVPLERLWHAVPSYPTLSEVWLRLLEEYGRPMPDGDNGLR
ncbi:dihydrolipoyl dehydrogenase family protein [Glaciibacter psychrotolerans]|uniref:Dihydrolipoamide dehydrogenase n=1 Tax=Glaciibacter psychrotolerans TaxID=670054 RepID=A0A7Z0EEQ3_9MICO|nr:NAD(P)/FAD-dependent oxidoreductase [Leifsonia psychrotolerans]NYJ20143.1 dihydrolipoamide dehydrogenase [Leifsonia psychrotolerans]